MIRLEQMKLAILNTFDGRMSEEEASRMAEFVMNFFGYSDRVLDNYLESADRSIFNMLEDEGLVVVRREEVFVKVGQRWRLNFWVLKQSVIERMSEPRVRVESVPTFQSMYEDIWDRLNAQEEATSY